VRLPDRQDTGALTLSYVIIFPAVLFAIMVIVQASLYYMAHNLALAAAQQGADVARQYNSTDGAGAAAAQALINQDGSGMLTDQRVTATRQDQDTTVQVTVTGRAWSLVPGLPVAVRETVQEPVERFVP
jgi:Flp pilus assembly protein TadG